jgi:putative transferase (TIGR04331 family)
MPLPAFPATHLPAGTWCFVGRDGVFPAWDRDFDVPDVLDVTIAERRKQFFRAARWGVEEMWELAADLKKRNDCPDLPDNVWEFLFGTWAVYTACFIDEAHAQLRTLKKRHGHERLTVLLLSEEPLPQWRDLSELGGFMGSTRGFHWLLSRLLEQDVPAAWNLKYQQHSEYVLSAAPSSAWPEPVGLRSWIKKHILAPLRLLAPLRSIRQRVSYMRIFMRTLIDRRIMLVPRRLFSSLWQRLVLSFALCCNRRKENNAIPLRTLFKDYPPVDFQQYRGIFRKLLPQGLYEIAKQVRRRRAVYTTYVAEHGDWIPEALLRQANILASGGRIVHIQHAPTYYDNFYTLSPTITLETAQHSYLCWGKFFHTDHRVENLPNFNYIKRYDSYAGQMTDLVYVHNNEQPLLDCFGLPGLGDTLWMRRAARQFFSGLDERVLSQSYFKSYPVNAENFDASRWMSREFPKVKIHQKLGEFFDTMKSRLLVSAYFRGCIVAQSMCQNIPTICFYREEELRFSPEAEIYLVPLREAGILRKDALDAAGFVNTIWRGSGVEDWWHSAIVQKARKDYLTMDISYGIKYPFLRWIKTMLSI